MCVNTRRPSHDDAVTFVRPMFFIVVNERGERPELKENRISPSHFRTRYSSLLASHSMVCRASRCQCAEVEKPKRTRDRATLPHFWGNARALVFTHHQRASLVHSRCVCVCVFDFKRFFFSSLASFVHSSLLARTHPHINSCHAHSHRDSYMNASPLHAQRLYYISGLASFFFFFLSLSSSVLRLCSARSNFYIVSFCQGILKRFYTLQTAYSFGCF